MALIYGLMRVIAFALVKKASWQHRRAKTRLENADKKFCEIETSCKAEEVANGRPANFASQFKLMKLFEVRDSASDRWRVAAKRLKKSERRSTWLKSWNGKKVSYAFGLLDMSLAFLGYQWILQEPEKWEQISKFLTQII